MYSLYRPHAVVAAAAVASPPDPHFVVVMTMAMHLPSTLVWRYYCGQLVYSVVAPFDLIPLWPAVSPCVLHSTIILVAMVSSGENISRSSLRTFHWTWMMWNTPRSSTMISY